MEIWSSVETYSDLEVNKIESSAAATVPWSKVGHQKLAAKASCSMFKFMKPLKDCTGVEIKSKKEVKAANGVESVWENASSKVYLIALATEEQKQVTAHSKLRMQSNRA